MDKKIEIELFRYRNLLFGKVLCMDESLRGAGTLYEGKLVDIKSSGIPDLEENILFVRGTTKSYDDNIFAYDYSNEEEAIRAATDIKHGINFINGIKTDEDLSFVHKII